MPMPDPNEIPDAAAQAEARRAIIDKIEQLASDVPELRTELAALAESNKELAESNRRSRLWMWALTSVALVLAVTVATVTVALTRSTRANDQAHRNKEYLVVTCESSNVARKAQRDLWGYILEFTAKNAKTPQTTAERKSLEVFRSYVNATFADKDCGAVAK